MPADQPTLFDAEPQPWEVDHEGDRQVATVVFSQAPHGEFDYAVPARLRGFVEAGRRVLVPLGQSNKARQAYCIAVAVKPRDSRPLKEVRSVLDDRPLLSPALLRLTHWMAERYLCDWGTVLEAVVPAGVRDKAGTRETILYKLPADLAARKAGLDLPFKQAEALRVLEGEQKALTLQQLTQLAHCTAAPIGELRKKGLVEIEKRRLQRMEVVEPVAVREENHALNVDQQAALAAILGALQGREHQQILLHGVTGSGKTEVYIRAIEEVVGYGRQAIVLVPEISLTPQTKQRFQARFDRVAVLHSHLSPVERHWHWQRIAAGEVQVVVGARSAVFAPTPHLGLIVIDEEHDASFKQDSAPRYHARDVARQRAQSERVPLVLGSATPSLESWFAAQKGESRLLSMPTRVYARPLPKVGTIDLREEFRTPALRGAISRPLHAAIEEAIQADGQVILLLNRRGFATQIQCPSCGHVVKCKSCDIALTHHRDGEKATCHYCDYTIDAPPLCPQCRYTGIRYTGLGTQRLEAEVRSRFPQVPCLRMDSDTMRRPGSHEAALQRFRSGEVKILLGTQMIAKGLDFPNVTLVGVINADTALHLPDFRAAERTFQLVTQVAGRTGRGAKGGKVLVQTFSPEHTAIQAAIKHDYLMFARHELAQREEFGYPPATSLVRIVVRGPVEQQAEEFAASIAAAFEAGLAQQPFSARVLGPTAAPIAKIQDLYRFHMLLASADGEMLRRLVALTTAPLKAPGEVQWIVDVDPQDML